MRLANFLGGFQEDASWIRAMFEKGRDLKASLGAEHVADLSLGNPLQAPDQRVLNELVRVVGDPTAHGYTSNLGLDETRDTISAYLKGKSSIPFQRAHVAVVAGAAGGLVVALRALADQGETVGVFSPYFTEYPFYAKALGLHFESQALAPPFIPTLEDARRLMKKKPRVVLINSPNNPTGQVWGKEAYAAIRQAIDELRPNDRPDVVFDDPYAEIVYDGLTPPFPLSEIPQALYISSFSKTWAIPGARVGFLAVHPDNPLAVQAMDAVAFLMRALGFVSANASAQRMLARVGVGNVHPELALYEKHRDMLVHGLLFLGFRFVIPRGGFYVFPDVPEAFQDDICFVSRALADGLIVVPGRGFGDASRFRMVFSVSQETIGRALEKLQNVLRNPGPKI